jgi:hypothetical protein
MVPSAALAASSYVAYPGMYNAHPGIAKEVARAAAIVTANPPADLPQQPPDGEVPLAPDYAPVLDFAVAVAKLKYKNYSDSVAILGIEPSTNGKLQSELMVKHREGARGIATLEQGEAHVLSNYHSHATRETSAFLDANAKSFHPWCSTFGSEASVSIPPLLSRCSLYA